MHTIQVQWLDAEKSRACFSVPGRLEWSAEHITALIQVLSEIRAEMVPNAEESRTQRAVI